MRFPKLVLAIAAVSAPQVFAYLKNTCGGDGTFTCSSKTTETYNSETLVVSNCKFINCGSVIINGGSLTLNNIEIVGSGTASNSPLRFGGSATGSLNNVIFANNEAQGYSGAITIYGGSSNLTINNGLFKNNRGVKGNCSTILILTILN
jgi:hypothetical protein